jgi:CTP-dependent riboflavin kinase
MGIVADYQIYDLVNGVPKNIGPRMQQKMTALQDVLPEDLSGKSVLDVGCDFGFWSFLCASRGASKVLGLDRGRNVKGHGYVDLPSMNNERAIGTVCKFDKTNLGVCWKEFGKHDLVLLMSLYHHIYHQCEDHDAIWYWLSKHVAESLIWENPTDSSDSVVQMNVSGHLHPKYNKTEILKAASQYFDYEYIGPAEHEKTRSVYSFTPKKRPVVSYIGNVTSGAGGASKAFVYDDNRRIKEIEKAVGIKSFPGSLNVILDSDFDYGVDYYRARVSDVAERGKGLDTHWKPMWARFYPVMIDGLKAFVFRFEGESYPLNFIEIISDKRLRDYVGDRVNVSRYP